MPAIDPIYGFLVVGLAALILKCILMKYFAESEGGIGAIQHVQDVSPEAAAERAQALMVTDAQETQRIRQHEHTIHFCAGLGAVPPKYTPMENPPPPPPIDSQSDMDNSTDLESGEDTALMLPQKKKRRHRHRQHPCTDTAATDTLAKDGDSSDEYDDSALPSYAVALAAAVVSAESTPCTNTVVNDANDNFSNVMTNTTHDAEACQNQAHFVENTNADATVLRMHSLSESEVPVSQALPQSTV
eukprot:m.110605 g.110605  ORF g.110605 m.110605 type:complete len:244 (-) comp16984_c0_seq1:228-959(-)